MGRPARGALAAWWLCATCLLLPAAADEPCDLPELVPPGDRINVTVGGESMPLGIVWLNWTSAIAGASLTKLLMQVLGYDTIFSSTAITSRIAFSRIASCVKSLPDHADDCSPGTSRSHIAWEVWLGGEIVTYNKVRLLLGDEAPRLLGHCGFQGSEAPYIYQGYIDRVYERWGFPLDFYRIWNSSWYDFSPLFSQIYDIPEASLKSCSDVEYPDMEEFRLHTGDEDGVEEVDGRLVARCMGGPQGKWWLAPSCRAEPEKCIPMVTGGDGWGIDLFMHKAAAFNLPWAIGCAADRASYQSVPNEFTVVQYWWVPDATFLENSPQRIMFPPYDEAAFMRGDKRSNTELVDLGKFIHPQLRVFAHRAHDLYSNMRVNLSVINEMMLDMVINGTDADTVACNWLKANKQTWTQWIPDERQCVSGWGLVDHGGAYLFSRNTSVGCDWCTPGRFSAPLEDDVGTTYVCSECPAGRLQAGIGETACADCETGRYQEHTGASTCSQCSAGTYSHARWTVCSNCTPGSYTDQIGVSECALCPRGMEQGNYGQTECVRCRKAFYAGPGMANCDRCEGDLTTEESGSTAAGRCMCATGTYRDQAANSTCHPCPSGMTCPFGSDEGAIAPAIAGGTCGRGSCVVPLTQAGYMTKSSEPLKVYRCLTDRACPVGIPGSCGVLRDASQAACGRCLQGAYENKGECTECSDNVNTALIFVVIVVSAVLGLVVLVFAVNKDLITQSRSVATCVVVFGLMISAMQTVGVFRNLAMDWISPLGQIFASMALLSFDLEILQFECAATSFDPVTKYFFRQLVLPFALIVIFVVIVVKKALVKPTTRIKIEFVNTAGTIFQALFTSIATSAVLPLVCYSHPDGNGRSMVSEPSVLCFEDAAHDYMLAIGILVFCLELVPFMSLVAYATLKYPRMSAQGAVELGAYRFLFFRFKAHVYFYGSIFLLRSLLICLVPVVISDDQAFQIATMCLILQCFHIVQVTLQPWRTGGTNLIDGIISAVLVMFLVVGAMSLGTTTNQTSVMLLGYIFFGLMCAVFHVSILCCTYLYLRPGAMYGAFICHHKADAAAQARYLKILLSQATGKSVFIDSDDLTDLDTLFDTVRTRVKHLVVYLTRDTLTRPWCAGELATAFSRHVKVTAVKCSGWYPPTEDQMAHVEDFLDLSSTNLLQYGITLPQVVKGFRSLLEMPSLSLESGAGGSNKFQKLTCELVGMAYKETRPPPITPGMVVISSNHHSDEATAAVGILVSKIRTDVFALCLEGICSLADYSDLDEEQIDAVVGSSRSLVVILSVGSLQCVQQLQAICGVASHMVPVLIDGFKFPTDAYYAETLPRIFPGRDGASAKIQSSFRKIAVSLSPSASDTILQAQAAGVVQRLPKPPSTPSAASGSLRKGNTFPFRGKGPKSKAPAEETGRTHRIYSI